MFFSPIFFSSKKKNGKEDGGREDEKVKKAENIGESQHSHERS
jgi:hypothetical protein